MKKSKKFRSQENYLSHLAQCRFERRYTEILKQAHNLLGDRFKQADMVL